MFQKFKKLVEKIGSKKWNFAAGFMLAALPGLAFIPVMCSVPFALLALSGCAYGLLAGKCIYEAFWHESLSASSYFLGAVAGIATPYLAGAYALEKKYEAAENIFKSDCNAVTQTFNHIAPSIKDGFTYKGVTYKAPTQDMTKKAA